MTITGITQREFARLDGCDEKQVRRKIADGHLTTLPDGSLDPALVGTAWRQRRAKKAQLPVDLPQDDSPDATIDDSGFIIPKKVVSEAKKMAYAAAREELDYKREIEELVPIADIVSTVVEELSNIRSALLHIPTKAAPRLVLLKTSAQMKALLEEEIAEVLEKLTLDVQNRS